MVSVVGLHFDRRDVSAVFERALLSAAGHCGRGGLFLHEVGALRDGTDVAMRAAIEALPEAGNPGAVSTVVGSTFAPFTPGVECGGG